MDITSLYNVSSAAVKQAEQTSALGQKSAEATNTEAFDSVLNAALENLHTTNSYLSDAENEQIRWALGETENTHDLTIALQKASTALQYTVAIRDKFLEAYKEIMNIQI
ncbi:MAG: flagellar hook-basal body complex protein FliE [Lachnospiraceae bacterium]|nr:flagellar hook-basal body complex protein FliE [Lachnospiraceae bacterium]